MQTLLKFAAVLLTTALSILFLYNYQTNSKIQELDHLYIMYWPDRDIYKIGRSIDPDRRRSEVDRDIDGINNQQITLIKTLRHKGQLENYFHRMFKNQRIYIDHLDGSCGTEWFILSSQDIAKIS